MSRTAVCVSSLFSPSFGHQLAPDEGGSGTPTAPRPGAALPALDHAGRLTEHVGALAGVGLNDRERLDGEAGVRACAADPVVPLERGDRAVARAAARQERTATNQRPARRVLPPPSSSASSAGVK